MKKHSKKLLIIAMAVAIFGAGCRKLNMAAGKLVVKMTDAPALYDEVNVEIKEVQVHYTDSTGASGGWVTLATNAGVYDLLKLQNDVTAVIATGTKLPAGKIHQIRLILGTQNTVVVDSAEFALKIPSGGQTGIKINLDTVIDANADYQVTLDFDALKSVVVLGNGGFNLKPGITVKSITKL